MSRPKAKRCPRCGQVKSAGQFYRRRHGRRLSPYCQPCTRTASHEIGNRRRQDPAEIRQRRSHQWVLVAEQPAAHGQHFPRSGFCFDTIWTVSGQTVRYPSVSHNGSSCS